MALAALRRNILVSPEWLERLMICGDKINILDCTWHLPNSGRVGKEEFAEKHIPGAQFFDIDECADKNTDLPHMMPDAKTFGSYVGSLGINNQSLILCYDNHPQFPVFSAPRVWWTFKYFGHHNIAVLEGGLPTYISEGFEVTSQVDKVKDEFYYAKPKPHYLKNYEAVVENIRKKKFQLVDARPSGRFCGTAPEPRSDMKPGCIPNSVNIPFTDVFDKKERLLKSTNELLDIFESAGIDLDEPLVGTCGTGVSASVLALAAVVCGKPYVGVYDGSWTEWYKRAPNHLKENVPSG